MEALISGLWLLRKILRESSEKHIFSTEKKRKRLEVLLLGLGKPNKASKESLRRAYAAATRAIHAKLGKKVHIKLPELDRMPKEDLLQACAEGILLTNYAFTRLKSASLKETPSVLLEKVVFLDATLSDLDKLERLQKIVLGVHFVRDLVNDKC